MRRVFVALLVAVAAVGFGLLHWGRSSQEGDLARHEISHDLPEAGASISRSPSSEAASRAASDEPAEVRAANSSSARLPESSSRLGAPAPVSELPGESPYLYKGGVDADRTIPLLTGDNFGEFIDALREQGAGVEQARDLTTLYNESAVASLREAPGVEVRQLACGMKICAVQAAASDADSFNIWFKGFAFSPSAKVYALGRNDKILGDGSVEYRLVFSTDPESATVVRQMGAVPPNAE